MRFLRTGTGAGRVIGIARLSFFAAAPSPTLEACGVTWDGDAKLIPLLPGVAFDAYFPNIRSIDLEDRTLWGKEAQQHLWDEFQRFVAEAETHLAGEGRLPRRGVVPVVDAADRDPYSRADFIVRINERKERLWGELECAEKQDRDAIHSITDKVLWDWMTEQAPRRENSDVLLTALRRQFAYYRENGIPSDFRMREIGKAPFAARRALGQPG